jgi:hypothetical protein
MLHQPLSRDLSAEPLQMWTWLACDGSPNHTPAASWRKCFQRIFDGVFGVPGELIASTGVTYKTGKDAAVHELLHRQCRRLQSRIIVVDLELTIEVPGASWRHIIQ